MEFNPASQYGFLALQFAARIFAYRIAPFKVIGYPVYINV
jgi:hypothetical protein